LSIAGVSASLRRLLEDELVAESALGDYTVSLFSTRHFRGEITNTVALFLFRVEVDETRRLVDLPPAIAGAPRRLALGLELHYLLTVWGKQSAEGEQVMLANCMDILSRHAVLDGSRLTPAYAWEPGEALRVTPSHLPSEDLLRLWDSLEPPYQLSVPYIVRTARLPARERIETPPTDTRTLVFVPAVHP